MMEEDRKNIRFWCSQYISSYDEGNLTIDEFREFIKGFLMKYTNDEVNANISVGILEKAARGYESGKMRWDDVSELISKAIDCLLRRQDERNKQGHIRHQLREYIRAYDKGYQTLDGFRRIITDYLETLTDDEVLITVSVAILEASATAYESYRIDWNDTCAYIDKVVDALFKNDNN